MSPFGLEATERGSGLLRTPYRLEARTTGVNIQRLHPLGAGLERPRSTTRSTTPLLYFAAHEAEPEAACQLHKQL